MKQVHKQRSDHTVLADTQLPPGVAERRATMPGLLRHRARTTPDRVALREKTRGIWCATTWGDYFEQVRAFALFLQSEGFGADDKLAIASDGTPEWFIADLAAQSLGGVTVGIYPTNPWPELQYIVRHCRAKVVLCGDQEQTDKVLEARRRDGGLATGFFELVVVEVIKFRPRDDVVRGVLARPIRDDVGPEHQDHARDRGERQGD